MKVSLTPDRARGFLALVSLAALAVGSALERPSLGLIVPGGIVFVCLVWSHLRG